MVLISSSQHLQALKEREDLAGAVTFAESEALRALDAITRQRPEVIALERVFAATSRGTALINRIKADPALAACEIRIVAHDNTPSRVAARAASGHDAPAVAVADPPNPPIQPLTQPSAPLDQRGTRRAPRFKILDGIEVQVDGNPAKLVDLSVVGAQVISPMILKPNQRVRVVLPDDTPSERINAAIAWASFEIAKRTVRYRAGVEFFDADATVMSRFIEKHRK
jgi:hypothetical protein